MNCVKKIPLKNTGSDLIPPYIPLVSTFVILFVFSVEIKQGFYHIIWINPWQVCYLLNVR